MNPVQLNWMAWEAEGASGYAHVAEKFHFHLLQDKRFRFVNSYSDPWDCLVCVATPARWTLGRDLVHRPDLVFHTMFEANPLPPGWAEVLNCAGMVWVPSQYAVDLFKDSGVTAEIVKVGYGIDHEQYQEVDRSHHDRENMTFVLWADTLFSRKNVVRTVKAFVAAELPKATLEIKLHSFAGMNLNTMFSDGKGNPLANITIHTGSWQRKKIVKWLHEADFGIYGSGGEGFGLQPPEMMATGLPVICANNTGMMEYLKPGNHLPVACPKQVKDLSYTLGYGYDAMTWEFDFEEMVEQIRWAYNNREKAYEIGAQGAMEARRWQWKNQANTIGDILVERYGRNG